MRKFISQGVRGCHVYFPAYSEGTRNVYVGYVISFVDYFETKVGRKSRLRFTGSSIENDVWMKASIVDPDGSLSA